jgi:hypothetical protein
VVTHLQVVEKEEAEVAMTEEEVEMIEDVVVKVTAAVVRDNFLNTI